MPEGIFGGPRPLISCAFRLTFYYTPEEHLDLDVEREVAEVVKSNIEQEVVVTHTSPPIKSEGGGALNVRVDIDRLSNLEIESMVEDIETVMNRAGYILDTDKYWVIAE